MGKWILISSNIETEKHPFYHYKSPIFLDDVDTENILVSKNISSSEKAMNTFLVTCIMIVKLSHYTLCFRNRQRM